MAQLVFYAIGVLVLASSLTIDGAKLESYNVDPLSTTVSGLSSGGAMAMQFHVAFSNDVHAAGIFAGLPFACAKGGLIAATSCMNSPGLQDVNKLVGEINTLATASKIDPTSNLDADKVFIFHGTKDTTVGPAAGTKIKEIYERFGVQISTKFDMAAVHGYPTNFYGAACGSSSASTQYINNCNYHGAYVVLNYLYGGNLIEPTGTVALNGYFGQFEQTEFGASSSISMDSIGFVYVPSGCMDRTKKCKFHIALHGCQQSRTTAGVGDIYAKKTGYLEVAELNDIIVLFPQAAANLIHGNPNACWDWWGYLNINYLNKDGAQMKALHKMLDRVVNCDGATDCYGEETPAPTTTTTLAPTPTTTTAPGTCKPNDVSFEPFPGKCDFYTMCACGAQVLLQCAPGLYFDPKITTCNFQQLVDCQNDAVSMNKFFYHR